MINLTETTIKYPQSSYHYLQKSLMNEWKCIQRVITETDDQLQIIGKAIKDKFLPTLYELVLINNNDTRMKFMDCLIKFGGLALSNPSKEGTTLYNNSCKMSRHLSNLLQQKQLSILILTFK